VRWTLSRLRGVKGVQDSIAHKEVLIRYDLTLQNSQRVCDTRADLGYTVREPDRAAVFGPEGRGSGSVPPYPPDQGPVSCRGEVANSPWDTASTGSLASCHRLSARSDREVQGFEYWSRNRAPAAHRRRGGPHSSRGARLGKRKGQLPHNESWQDEAPATGLCVGHRKGLADIIVLRGANYPARPTALATEREARDEVEGMTSHRQPTSYSPGYLWGHLAGRPGRATPNRRRYVHLNRPFPPGSSGGVGAAQADRSRTAGGEG
jgi:hypothetical protein